MKSLNGLGRWGGVVGVVVAGVLLSSLTLRGASAGDVQKGQPKAAPADSTGSRVDRIIVGPGIPKIADLPVLPPVTVDYRDDSVPPISAQRSRGGEGSRHGALGTIAVAVCTYPFECDDCNPCTLDACADAFCEGGDNDGYPCNTAANCEGVCNGGSDPGAHCFTDEDCCGASPELHGTCDFFPCTPLGSDQCINVLLPRRCDGGDRDERSCDCPGGTCDDGGTGLCVGGTRADEPCICLGGTCELGFESGSECDDGFVCNGRETCAAGVCQAGTPLCETGERCDEAGNACLQPCLTATGECNADGLKCTNDVCDAKKCVGGFNNDGECRTDVECCIDGDCASDTDGGTCTGGGTGECIVGDPHCGPGGGCAEPFTPTGPVRCDPGRCCVGTSCNEAEFTDCTGDWLATSQACLPLSSGNVNKCPLYGSGIAPQGNYVVAVGPVSNSQCALTGLGDDYNVPGEDYIDVELLRFVSSVQSSIRYSIEFWDVSGPSPILIEDVFFPDGSNRGTSDMAVVTVDFDPPLTVPANGVVSFSVQTNFGPNGSASWMSTDEVDVGVNMPGTMFVNGELVADFLGRCSGGGRAGQWCDRHQETDLIVGCPGGGTCEDVPDILAFELVATARPDPPKGACCITLTGQCSEELPWICESQGNSFQEVGQGCNVCSNDPLELNCRAGEHGDCFLCQGGGNDTELCCPGDPPGVCSGVNGTCDTGDRAGEECCPGGDCDITPVCLPLPPSCELRACCDAVTGECIDRPRCIGGPEDGRGCVKPEDLIACVDVGGGTCETSCPVGTESSGFGTTCDPNCCETPLELYTGGDNCTLVDIPVINVPTLGAPPVVYTTTGSNSNATFDDYPDLCDFGIFNPEGTTQDPGWWEAFSIDDCADVRVQLCCSDKGGQPLRPAWGGIIAGCPCETFIGDSGAALPIGVGRGTSGFARGGPFCDEDNLWMTFPSLPKGIYYYPLYSAPDGTFAHLQGGGQYQFNVVVGACAEAACCLPTATCVDGSFPGVACEVDEDCCVDRDCETDPLPGSCRSDCAVITELECEAAGGYWLAGTNIPDFMTPVIACLEGSDGVCNTGSCCAGPADCEDRLDPTGEDCNPTTGANCMDKRGCDLRGDTYVGGPRCDFPEPACPVCTADSEGNCQGTTSDWYFTIDRANPSGRKIADDFIAVGSEVSQICWHAIISPPGSLGTACDPLPPDDWEIRFYEDDNGAPGAELANSPGSVEVAKELLDDVNYYLYSAVFTPKISVSPNSRYWVEISGTGTPDESCTVYKQASEDGNLWAYWAFDVTSGWTPEDRNIYKIDFEFCIDSGIVVPPEQTGGCCECDSTCSDDVLWYDCAGFFVLEDPFPRGAPNLGQFEPGKTCDVHFTCENEGGGGGCPGAPEVGEDCVIPEVIDAGVHSVSNRCSTTDGRTQYSNCDDGPAGTGNDLWYQYTATCTGNVQIDMCGDTDFAAVVAVFNQRVDGQCPTECPPPLNTMLGGECLTDHCANEPAPKISARAFPGDCFLIRVAGWWDPDEPGPAEKGRGSLEVECETACFQSSPPVPEPDKPTGLVAGVDPVNIKNRFISLTTNALDAGVDKALRVTYKSLPPPFDVWNDMIFFVGEPREVCENSGKGLETLPEDCPAALPTNTFWAAPLVCDKGGAHYMDWHGWCNAGTCVGGLKPGTSCVIDDDCVEYVHIYSEGIVPSLNAEHPAEYEIQVVDPNCNAQEEESYSAPLTMIQSRWGDVCGPGPGGACSSVSDGIVDVANDVLGVLDKFANLNNLQKARADLEPGDFNEVTHNGPDFKVNVANDVLFCLSAFTGGGYPFGPGNPCFKDPLKLSRAGR